MPSASPSSASAASWSPSSLARLAASFSEACSTLTDLAVEIGQVVIGNPPGCLLGPLGGPNLGELHRRCERVLSHERGNRGVLTLPGRLRDPRVQQHLTARADALLVEALDHVRVDLAVQAEGPGPRPGPPARRTAPLSRAEGLH
jgi:hypothetical protein